MRKVILKGPGDAGLLGGQWGLRPHSEVDQTVFTSWEERPACDGFPSENLPQGGPCSAPWKEMGGPRSPDQRAAGHDGLSFLRALENHVCQEEHMH